MKTVLKILLVILLLVVLLAGGLLAFLTATEYRPDDVSPAEFASSGEADAVLSPGDSLTVLSWNTGYACLDKSETFVMDGGKGSGSADSETVSANIAGISAVLAAHDADIYMLQEVDSFSSRSGKIDQRAEYLENISAERDNGFESVFALNYSCPFVPFPLPPMGRINSGILTVSDMHMEKAERLSLPCPFSWPLRTANLKRCLLPAYIDLEGTDAQLVIVNLHLEAYDDGAGKAAQTEQLMNFIAGEYKKGNYVIAGGDFNQAFPGSVERYVCNDENSWVPGVLEEGALPEGFSYAYDPDIPTCRSLAEEYDGSDDFTFYLIDGFILSPNLRLDSVTGIDAGFEFTDHNPVLMQVTLIGPEEG